MDVMILMLLMAVSAALLFSAGRHALRISARGHQSLWKLAAAPLLTVLSIAALRLPLYMDEFFPTALLHGVVSGMQTIGLNESLAELMVLSGRLPEGWKGIYDFYTAFQYVCAPLICGYTLFRALIDMRARAKLAYCARPVYFFSKLTEEAVVLAESIDRSVHAEGADPLFCFCAADEKGEYKTRPCWQRAQGFGAVAAADTLTARLFPRLSGHVTCVLCSPDENENIKDLSRLLREEEKDSRIRRKQTVKHFVFGDSAWAEQAVDALAASCGNDLSRSVFMLNPKENLAAHILHRYPLHAYCGQGEDGRARLNVLVVGSTPLADWFLRTAYACGQLCDCEQSITLAAQDAEAYRERLLLAAPMIAREEHPLIRDCGKLQFVRLEQTEEAAAPALLGDKDYVFLALEKDEDNAMLAARIASVIDRQKLTDARRAAQRVAVVYAVQDEGLGRICRTLNPQSAPKGACELIPVGDRESCYQVDVLLEPALLYKAYFVSLAYKRKLTAEHAGDVEQFAAFAKRAYGRRSSMACALQMEYYHQMQALGGDTAAKLADAEHRRWSAYTIMDGYDEPTRGELEAYLYRNGDTHRSKALKLHPCLVTSRTDAFERMSKEIDRLLYARIAEAFAGEGITLHIPQGDERAARTAIEKAAAKLGNREARERIEAMSQALHTDYRAYDSVILECVGDILNMMKNTAVQAALSRYWQ